MESFTDRNQKFACYAINLNIAEQEVYMFRLLNMPKIYDHYRTRYDVAKRLHHLLVKNDIQKYATLAVGEGNYSASDHDLGPRILGSSTPQSVFSLGSKLRTINSAQSMLTEVYKASIPYLKVSVGSEMAMMLRPKFHWVANTRSIWAHLLIKHNFDFITANEELKLYRENDVDSQMSYRVWREIHAEMKTNFRKLAILGAKEAKAQNCQHGGLVYLWADAVANELYERREELMNVNFGR